MKAPIGSNEHIRIEQVRSVLGIAGVACADLCLKLDPVHDRAQPSPGHRLRLDVVIPEPVEATAISTDNIQIDRDTRLVGLGRVASDSPGSSRLCNEPIPPYD